MKLLPAPLVLGLVLLGAPSGARAEKPKPQVVLVEADGRDVELSAFVARFESELSDRGKLAFSDARLSGARLGPLASEPDGQAARTFRAEWPGDYWIAVSLSQCRVEVSRMTYRDRTDEGYTVDRVVENVRVDCDATVRVVDAATGKEGRPFTVTGTANYRRANAEEDESSELEGSRDAAEKAAKKLPGALPR